ncbi:MAG: hypothetical protein IT160_07670 [Bryobacterales bacterium]|nr:hypothetical protein [Bryobacterales bacterium]
MVDYEKLGVFYLGRKYDAERRARLDEPILYDSRDLLTHAVCVGMTGSGKTGLCIGLIEEAAIDGIPSLVVDLKGDLTNLALTFPNLTAADLRPFVNVEEAAVKGLDAGSYAAQQADLWRHGLAEWDQTPERIGRLKESAEVVIYTPASSVGTPVSILGSFAAPTEDILDDREAMRQRVTGAAASLLALAGIESGDTESREQILLATLLDRAWREGKDAGLADIIRQIQQPPVTRVGVLDLDTFFPPKDRTAFALRINNLLASPGFEAWLEGEPLDVDAMLHAPSGKPRIAIVSVAHLNDTERMFFLSLLLNQVVGWMRTQSGTTSLRALLYLDEIFGFFPPVSNPPTKQALLTLLKQARAFGLGVVLATQNPVDIDYKGLSNAGTWFVGRLQTEQDKRRLLDGLEGAAGQTGAVFDRAAADRAISSLGKRIFLLHDIHSAGPQLFETRWTLSYLRGPLSREQLRLVARPVSAAANASAAPPRMAPVIAASDQPPVLAPGITQRFLPVRSAPAGVEVVYKPMIYGSARVRFANLKPPVEAGRAVAVVTAVAGDAVALDWNQSQGVELTPGELENEARGGHFEDPPAAALKQRNYAGWQKALETWIYQSERLQLLRSPSTGLVSTPDEPERDFRIRLQQACREERDRQAEVMRARYAPKIAALEERRRRAQQSVQREQEQVTQQRLSTAVSMGATLLGAFLGRKTLSATTLSRAGTAARSYGRLNKENQDVQRAGETVEAIEQQLADLNSRFAEELNAVQAKLDALSEGLETVSIAPKRADITVEVVCLAWAPYWRKTGEQAQQAW